MSQYPGYPPFPPAAYSPQMMTDDPRRPAKLAGLMMIILGLLILLLGGCVGLLAALVPQMRANREAFAPLEQLEAELGVSATMLFAVVAIIFGVIALLQIVIGIFCRSGSLLPLILGIVVTSLAILYMLLNAVASIGQPQAFAGVCMSVVMLAIFAVQLILLIQGVRKASEVKWHKMMASGMQPQGWPMQPMAYPPQQGQQQAPYNYGYGYGAPPPPQSPPQQQPPQPPGDNGGGI